jgi:acetyl-CoA acetyltransferase
MRQVAVVGVGMARFGQHPQRSAADLGVEAVLSALADAGLSWPDVQAAWCGAVGLGMTAGTRVLAELGLTGAPISTVDNASASGSTAFREACLSVACGLHDVALAVGVGKMTAGGGAGAAPDRREILQMQAMGFLPPAGVFAMRTRRRMHDYGATIVPYARVSVKNHRHGSLNPFAQFQKEVTLEEVLQSRLVCDPLTVLHCCPVGDGAAAAVVASLPRARRLSVKPLVRVAASAFRSEVYSSDGHPGPSITELTARQAYDQAGAGPGDMDLVQVHDAFTVEEIDYYESLGFCRRGEGERLVEEGATAIGGRIPFNTDGGLLARGHPIGPTGLAQVWETVVQLRGRAGPRQVEGARAGLCQMIGAGGVCVIHILKR